MYKRFRQVYSKIIAAVAITSGVSILVMMAYSFLNVSLRYLINFPLGGLIEATAQLMIYVIFFGAAYCQLHHENIRVDAIAARVTPRVAAVLDVATYAIGIVFFALMAYFSIEPAVESTAIREVTYGDIPYPMYPQKWAIVIGCALIALQLVFDLTDSVGKLIGKGSRPAAPGAAPG
jgi:TRAP-type C4-dicarboxylate transport system permease small subunit